MSSINLSSAQCMCMEEGSATVFFPEFSVFYSGRPSCGPATSLGLSGSSSAGGMCRRSKQLLTHSRCHVCLFGLQPSRLLCPWGFQARILEWVAISFSRDGTLVSRGSCTGDNFTGKIDKLLDSSLILGKLLSLPQSSCL